MDLTEVEDIKKKWQEYTKELYKKDHTIMIIWVMKIFFCTVLLCILATSS